MTSSPRGAGLDATIAPIGPDHRGLATAPPRWMRRTLLAAALYNIVYGAWVVLRPLDVFAWAGLAAPNYPEIWQCVGMIVGVYGVGYALAAADPLKHWPIVLVGLLGKVFGPIGFIDAWWRGVFNLRFGAQILTNDLIWWVPFFLIVRRALTEQWLSPTLAPPIADWRQVEFGDGARLGEWVVGRRVRLVFLRHVGCTFCREWMSALSQRRTELSAGGWEWVFVHMSDPESGRAFLARYGFGDARAISDPTTRLYRSVGLVRGGFWATLGPRNWLRGFVAGVWRGHGVGWLEGDGFQMGGLLEIEGGEITRRQIVREAWEELSTKIRVFPNP